MCRWLVNALAPRHPSTNPRVERGLGEVSADERLPACSPATPARSATARGSTPVRANDGRLRAGDPRYFRRRHRDGALHLHIVRGGSEGPEIARRHARARADAAPLGSDTHRQQCVGLVPPQAEIFRNLDHRIDVEGIPVVG